MCLIFVQLNPPPEKRPKLEPVAPESEPTPVFSDGEPKKKEEVKEDVRANEQPSKSGTDTATTDEPCAIKGSHLELDDIPPELLPKHHELILKQVGLNWIVC